MTGGVNVLIALVIVCKEAKKGTTILIKTYFPHRPSCARTEIGIVLSSVGNCFPFAFLLLSDGHILNEERLLGGVLRKNT